MDQSLYWALNINLSKVVWYLQKIAASLTFLFMFILLIFFTYTFFFLFLKSKTVVILLWMNRYHSNSICTQLFVSSFYWFCNVKYFLTEKFRLTLFLLEFHEKGFNLPYKQLLAVKKARPSNSRFGKQLKVHLYLKK